MIKGLAVAGPLRLPGLHAGSARGPGPTGSDSRARAPALPVPQPRGASSHGGLVARAGRWAAVLRGLALLLCGMLQPALAVAAPHVRVLVTEPSGYYQEAADSLLRALKREAWRVSVATAGTTPAPGADLTVAIGTRALEAALAAPARPVLALLVPRSSYDRLAAGKPQVSALYLDQPLERQLRLLRLALPELKQVGVPLGPTSRELQGEIGAAARASGVQVDSVVVERGSDLYPALTELARDSQAFILLPDPLVAQRSGLHNLFLHTYRLKRPVLAYSAPLAKSGAMLALHATPAQQGEEAAGWIRDSWTGAAFRLGAPRHPQRFAVSVNRSVARSLEITLPDEAALEAQLGAPR